MLNALEPLNPPSYSEATQDPNTVAPPSYSEAIKDKVITREPTRAEADDVSSVTEECCVPEPTYNSSDNCCLFCIQLILARCFHSIAFCTDTCCDCIVTCLCENCCKIGDEVNHDADYGDVGNNDFGVDDGNNDIGFGDVDGSNDIDIGNGNNDNDFERDNSNDNDLGGHGNNEDVTSGGDYGGGDTGGGSDDW